MSDKPKKVEVKKGDQVCFWLAFGQPYLATVVEVYEMEGAPGPTIDLSFPDRMVLHVNYDPNGQPRSYCLSDDPGWPGTLSKIVAADAGSDAPEAEAEAPKAKAEEAPKAQTVAGTARRSQAKED